MTPDPADVEPRPREPSEAREGALARPSSVVSAGPSTNRHDERFRLLTEATNDAVWDWDIAADELWWNEGITTLFGIARDDMGRSLERWADRIHPEDRRPTVDSLRDAVASGRRDWSAEYRFLRKDGTYAHVLDRGRVLHDASGTPVRMVGGMRDVSERKALEAQVMRAQRMESIGTLAGGIAHDLNNVLAPILLASSVLRLGESDLKRRADLDTIQRCARRGADMVQKLLAFARGGDEQRTSVVPADIVRDVRAIVGESFPKKIRLSVELPDDPWHIRADPTQMHQLLMNLCVNARDAMPDGGDLSIAVEHVVLDDVYAGMHVETRPGPYVLLRVEDTGVGMRPETVERIFDPFFTTKEVGQGTGLGLSTAHSIVRSHGGFIHVYSEPGRGSRFKVYLPADLSPGEVAATSDEQAALPRGRGELVLVVDDEEPVRTVTSRTLERFGYRTIVASNGAEAISAFVRNQGEIAVVLTDMTMPVLDGPSTIIALKAIDPEVRIIASSGLGANGQLATSTHPGVRHFVPKPYTADVLLRVLRKVLTG
jgi:PAS domain S-box-containing protein